MAATKSTSHKELLLLCEQLRGTQAQDWGRCIGCVLLIQGFLNTAPQEVASPEGGKWEPAEVIEEDSDTQSLWPYLLSAPAEYKSIQPLLLSLQEIRMRK